ncbi:MAG: aminotransferase class V-fold PLP-dependent enzyme, partial [Christensenellales bacterium]
MDMRKDYRSDFPLIVNSSIAYLDNAATAQRPQCVIDAESDFYLRHNANPMRGLYELSIEATDIYE